MWTNLVCRFWKIELISFYIDLISEKKWGFLTYFCRYIQTATSIGECLHRIVNLTLSVRGVGGGTCEMWKEMAQSAQWYSSVASSLRGKHALIDRNDGSLVLKTLESNRPCSTSFSYTPCSPLLLLMDIECFLKSTVCVSYTKNNIMEIKTQDERRFLSEMVTHFIRK